MDLNEFTSGVDEEEKMPCCGICGEKAALCWNSNIRGGALTAGDEVKLGRGRGVRGCGEEGEEKMGQL